MAVRSPPFVCAVASFLNWHTTATWSPKCSSSYTVAKSPPTVAKRLPQSPGRWLNARARTERSNLVVGLHCSRTIVFVMTFWRKEVFRRLRSVAACSSASRTRLR